MKLKEAQEKILTICNIPFSELFDEEDFPMIIKNKGSAQRDPSLWGFLIRSSDNISTSEMKMQEEE